MKSYKQIAAEPWRQQAAAEQRARWEQKQQQEKYCLMVADAVRKEQFSPSLDVLDVERF